MISAHKAAESLEIWFFGTPEELRVKFFKVCDKTILPWRYAQMGPGCTLFTFLETQDTVITLGNIRTLILDCDVWRAVVDGIFTDGHQR